MSWTRGEPSTVTADHLESPWACGKPGEYFRCYLCGYRFELGDYFRFVFTNDMRDAGGNPLVCKNCDEGNEAVRAEWKRMNDDVREMKKGKYWALLRRR